MSISLPAGATATSGQSGNQSSFDSNLNIAKSSRILTDHMNQNGQSTIHKDDLKKLADNDDGNVSQEVSAAAAYMIRHEDVFTAIETHDVATQDDFSGVWNVEWAANGGLDGTSISAIAKMEDTFDRAIFRSAQITEVTTGKKTELDGSKQRPQN